MTVQVYRFVFSYFFSKRKHKVSFFAIEGLNCETLTYDIRPKPTKSSALMVEWYGLMTYVTSSHIKVSQFKFSCGLWNLWFEVNLEQDTIVVWNVTRS